MRTSTLRPALTLAFAALLVPAALVAQSRALVSKEVSIGRSDAMLRLEFADAGKLTIDLRDGSIVVDGRTVGSYRPGGGLDSAWHTLLGRAVSLDDGALAKALRSWQPSGDLTGDQAEGAKTISSALDAALAPSPTKRAATQAPSPVPKVRAGDTTAAGQLRDLLDRSDRLADLGAALRDVDMEGARIRIDEDVDIQAADTLHGSLVVVDGNAKIAGTVEGDVVVVGGSLRLLSGSTVEGDVRLADASVTREGGTVSGTVVQVGAEQPSDNDLADSIRAQVMAEVRHQVGTRHRSVGFSLFDPVRRVIGGLGGILRDLLTVLLLGLVGLGVVTFAGTNLDAVAETARRTPGRSAAVGLAGTFLLVPVWLLGTVVLAVSIVGIPVMIAWLPLFPLAAVAAAILGYLAVAHNLGQWLAHSDLRFTDRIRGSNPIHTVFAGLVALAAAFIAANAVSMVPFFGFLRGLLAFTGVLITIVAVQIGFGAVLLTRGGSRPEYRFRDVPTDAQWDADMNATETSAAHTPGPGSGTGGPEDA